MINLDNLHIDNVFKNPYISDKYKEICSKSYPNLKIDPYCEKGIRSRAYQRFLYSTSNKEIEISDDSSYQQTYDANDLDGGKIREFEKIPTELINSNFAYDVIKNNINYIENNYPNILKNKTLYIGFHTIRYKATYEKPSFSSPIWLHKDDEDLVFLHFISKSDNLVGGDSIIATNKNSIDRVISLNKFMETIVLTRDFLHAVTPIGVSNKDENSYRDILLVTIENIERIK